MVVDPDPKVRTLMQRAFKSPEFEASTFASAQAALARLAAIQPHCIVSDLLMPDMDGERFLRAARGVPGLESVPFVVATGVRSEARIRSVLEAGADAYLLKPFPLRELLEKTRLLLKRPPQKEGPPPGKGAPRVPPAREAPAARGAGELPPANGVQGFGRYTRVEVEGRPLVLLTEATPQPKFVVTTVVTERGSALRKIETALSHPLAREEDQEAIRRQIDRQHESVLQRLPELVRDETPRRELWSEEERSVDQELLAWTISAIARLAAAEKGAACTTPVLRATLVRVAASHALLRTFQLTQEGGVAVDPQRGARLPRRAVKALAAWSLAFAGEAFRADLLTALELIRRATAERAAELERLGYYRRLTAQAMT